MKKYLVVLLFLFVAVSPAVSQTTNATETAEPTNKTFNAITATNLEQWKQVVKDLKRLGGFKYNQDWIMELHNPDGKPTRSVGRPFNFNYNGRTITYEATFINEVSTQLVVRLNGVDNARSYEMQVKNGGGWQPAGVFTQSRRIILTGLTPGQTYTVQARAVGGSTGYSDWSDPVSHMAM